MQSIIEVNNSTTIVATTLSSPSTPPQGSSLALNPLSLFLPPKSYSLSPISDATYQTNLEPLDQFIDDTSSLIATNTICCGILVAYKIIQHLVLGRLRVSEQQHLREAFWDYFLQKSLFILFILDAKSYEDRMPWAIWSTTLGSIALLSLSCKDRFEYLSSSPLVRRWSLIKISLLMSFLFLFTLLANALVILAPLTSNKSSSSQLILTHLLFLLADSTYILIFVTSVITKCLIITYDMRTNSIWENRTSITYYGDLIFALLMSIIDLLHHTHLLIIGYTSFIIKGWCLVRINTLVMAIRRRYRRHRNYLLVVQLMDSNFPMASVDDLLKNSDDCAICWDEMESARKLPCGHLFHNSCLRSWLEQDTSCPTCRTTLKTRQQDDLLLDDIEEHSESDEEFLETTNATTNIAATNNTAATILRTQQRNHFFHFDSSRYTNHPFLSWLPTISIEGFM